MNKQSSPRPPVIPERRSLWQPPSERGVISTEGRQWLEENADAIKAWNDYVEQHGLPLAKYRQF